MRMIDLSGQRFGRLTVLHRAPNSGRHVRWLCRCDCGREHVASRLALRNGHTQSCGCLFTETTARGTRRTHGATGTPEYRVWHHIRERCTNPRFRFYRLYGGRGICVAPAWHSFETFLRDVGPRPSPKHTLDRIDNDGDYAPGNCRWTTAEVQANNKSTNRRITIGRRTLTMAQWCRISGVDRDLASQRIVRDGWAPEDAVTKPARRVRRRG